MSTIGSQKAAVTTAVFLHGDGRLPSALGAALDCIQTSSNWELQRYAINKARAEAFQCIKVPALFVYDASGDESMRVIGDLKIIKFIECFKDDMV